MGYEAIREETLARQRKLVPAGANLIRSASFEKYGEESRGVATGILFLYHGDTKVGEGGIKTQPGYFQLAGEACVSGATAALP